jgi:hypothetical protein
MSQINTDKIASNSGGTTALTIADNGGVTASGTVAATSFSGSGASLTGFTSSQMPAGSVLQVVSSYTTTQVALSSSQTSYTDTGLSCVITPSSTSSSILIIAHQSFGKNNYDTQIDAQLVRASTVVLPNWLNDDVRTGDTQGLYLPPAALVHVDSPSTTSATTYKTQFRNAAGAGTVYVNNNSGHAKIILMEIAG